MTKDYDQLFQERVDELLLLEQRVDRRAEKFFALINEYQEKNQKLFGDFLNKFNGIDESFAKMNAASDSVNKYVTLSAKHATHTTKNFLGAIVAAVLIVASTLLWSNHINNSLSDAKAELVSLNIKLKRTPVILHFHGKDYVRGVPNSKTSFSHRNGDNVPGSYAEVWHIR